MARRSRTLAVLATILALTSPLAGRESVEWRDFAVGTVQV